MTNCIIRPADIEDSGQIGYIHYTAWIETYSGMIPKSFLDTRSAEKSALMFRENECKNIVVAECAGTLVGFCGYGEFREKETYKNIGEIHGIYLLDDYKRKHLGQKMLEYALEQLKIAGYDEVGLWVLEANKNAIGFYEKQGFVYSGKCMEEKLGEPMKKMLYTKKI